MKKIFVAFGTRPESIKLAPLIIALKKEPSFSVYVCYSGQHETLSHEVFDFFGIYPDENLRLSEKGSELALLNANALLAYKEQIEREKPDLIIVHGDTTTAFSASLAGFYSKIPVAHIEAGLRSYDMLSPFPEEWNRVAIDEMASFCFAPTEEARENLIRMQKKEDAVFTVGNTITDALARTVRKSYESELLIEGKRLLIFTAHRRENIGAPIENMCNAIKRIANEYKDVNIICPMHPNPSVRKTIIPSLSGYENIYLCEPLSVFDFQNILSRAYLVISDSGGVQEESATLGIPMLICRNTTERQEGVKNGIIKLVGTELEEIYEATKKLLDDKNEYSEMKSSLYSYGDGRVSQRIVKILKNLLLK